MTPAARPLRVLVAARFTSIHTRRFAEELQRQSVDVAAVYLGRSSERPAVRCFQPARTPRILRLPKTATIAALLYLRRVIREFAPDVVHIHDDPQVANWMRIVCPGGVKLAYTAWGHHPPELLSDRRFRRALGRADLLMSDAPDVLDEITPFSPKARRELMRFGADMGLFSPGPPDPEVLARYGLSPDGLYVLSPRSIRPNYNQLTLIRALPAVAAEFPALRLILKHHHVANYADSAPYEACLREEGERLGVWDRVVRLDHVPYEHLCHLYRVSRVAVSIPLEDGFPATIFESMAVACPLIVCRDRSYEGVIEDGVNSLTIPATDSSALAGALLRILSDAATAGRLRVGGHATVKEKGNFAREVAKAVQSYHEVVGT